MPCAAALARLDLLVVSENVASNDTVAPCACAPAGRGLGREGRHRHQLGAVHLAPARVPAAAGQRAARLVDAERGGAAAGLRRGVRLPLGRPRFSRSMRASPASRTRASAPSIFPAPTASSREAFDGLEPFQWPLRGGDAPTPRLFADGGFFTGDRMARFVAIAPPRLSAAVSEAWPFVLNTGRIRDQWHTMTRTGLSPRLSTHIAEPFVEIHPDDAARLRPGAGHAGAGDDRARLRRAARPGQPRTAAGHAVRADALVGREQLRGRASARWCSRRPIRSPASPRPRRRRRASRRSPLRTTASCCRASACNPTRSTYWARARARLSATSSTLRWMSRAMGWSAWLQGDPARRRSP